MRTRRHATIEDLRHAIDSLPRDTRIAMLDRIRHNEIIAGAYTGDGGICPMLAAHRAGGRTSCISFAKAWDAFAFRGARTRLARRATRRELLVLTSHLEVSLLEDDGTIADMGAAIAQHEGLVQARPAEDRPGDPTHRDFERQVTASSVSPMCVMVHDARRVGCGEVSTRPAVSAARQNLFEEHDTASRPPDSACVNPPRSSNVTLQDRPRLGSVEVNTLLLSALSA
jgi:hypothetical protein